jgi:hypothetical protein
MRQARAQVSCVLRVSACSELVCRASIRAVALQASAQSRLSRMQRDERRAAGNGGVRVVDHEMQEQADQDDEEENP